MRIFISLLLLLSSISIGAQTKSIIEDMKFDATLKTKYELATETGMSRFSVRNSRLGLYGDLAPYISYKFQLELSSEGKFDVLDLFGTIRPFKTNALELSLGQLSIPIHNSYMITPATMLFANRAFFAKYFIPGTRDIGATVRYRTGVAGVPVMFEGGIFNGGVINRPEWTKNPSYSGRVTFGTMDGWRSTVKFYRYPGNDTTDLLVWGADIRYGKKRYKVEAEVMNKQNFFNSDQVFSASIQGAYSFPMKNDFLFKDITPAIRWDAMGHHFESRGFDVNRLTFGLSFGLTKKPFSSLLRLDYEQYFIRDHIYELAKTAEMESNKVTLELLLVF